MPSFDNAVGQRSAPVGAVLLDHTQSARAIPVDDQLLAEDLHFLGAERTSQQLVCRTNRMPVMAEQRAHRRIWTHLGKQFVVFSLSN
jgi:hypothetical protein